MKQTFWDKNKVLLLGILGSLAIAVDPLLSKAPEDVTYKILAYAAASGVLSYVAREWRGQGLSILGIIGNLAGVASTVLLTGNVSIPQLIIHLILAIAMAAGADPKSRAYETQPVIMQAKIDAEKQMPAHLTSKKVRKAAKGPSVKR